MNPIIPIPDLVRQALGETTTLIGFDPVTQPLVVAVSGGPDSLTLLHALRSLIPAGQLIVAHLDHALRPSSGDEARRVVALAGAWGLRAAAARVDVAALARDERLSIEEAGRVARYRFLADVARRFGAPAIATGHNADDQVESVLMHLLRGAGPAGLRGMAVAGPLPEGDALWLLRPLLRIGRAQIEAYVADNGLLPITDESNLDTTFYRNRLRHELLPLLETVSPRVGERLTTLADIIAAEDDLLGELTAAAYMQILADSGDGWVIIDRSRWLTEPLALRRRLLRLALTRCLPGLRDAGFRSLEAARLLAEGGPAGSSASLPGGARLLVDADQLTLTGPHDRPTPDAPQLPDETPRPLVVPGTVALADGWTLSAERLELADPAIILQNPDPWTAYLDEHYADSLMMRPRLPGERFRPFGLRGGEKSVKAWMIDRKLPAALRGRWPIVATADHILWIPGQTLDYRGRVPDGARHVIRLCCGRRRGFRSG